MKKIFLTKPKSILLKIFGVITPWEFTDKLKKYSIENCSTFLDDHLHEERIQTIVGEIKKENDLNLKKFKCPQILDHDVYERILSYCSNGQRKNFTNNEHELLIYFKKSLLDYCSWCFTKKESNAYSPSNDLQSYLWEDAYKTGILKSELYEDCYESLKEWKLNKIRLFTFSKGTVQGQQAIFQYSKFGNLRNLIDGHISTNFLNLNKRDTACYAKISQLIDEKRKDILLLTCSLIEAKAATLSGFSVCLVKRNNYKDPRLDSVEADLFPIISQFNQLTFK